MKRTATPVSDLRSAAPPLALALTLAAGGCAGPLGPRESDRGPDIPVERFRHIEPFQLAPRPAVQDGQPGDPASIAARRFEGIEQVQMTLEEARASTLEHNLGLQVALVDPAIADQRLASEEAAFEAAFTLNGSYAKTDAPTASQLSDNQATFATLTPGVTIPLRTGGTAEITLPVARSDTSNRFSTLNPAYTSDLRLSISQPLLRNAGRRRATYGIRIAAFQSKIVQAQTKLFVINQIVAIDTAYWRLYQARQELEVRQRQLELAQAQLGRAERRAAAGMSAEIEVVRAQSGVAERLDAIITSQNLVLARQRELKRIANMPGLDVDSGAMVIPGTPPDPIEYEFDALALADAAVANRMEMLELELQLARDSTDIEFQENQALPQFSVNAGYTINGLGGSLGDSFEMLGKNNFEDWNIGFQASVPLGNERALATLRSAVLQRMQRLSSKDGRRQTVRQEVLDAADGIRASWQRVLAARQSVILNTRTLDAEQRSFDVGLSTSTNVLDAAARLADAQSAEIRAIVDYQISQINLAAASGTLLGAARIEWEPAAAPDLDGTFFAPRAKPEDR